MTDTAKGMTAAAEEEIARRAAAYKGAAVLTVDYYRIGWTLQFDLPLSNRPDELPQVPGLASYPWDTWLWWELEERIVTLWLAGTVLGDETALSLARRDLLALADWPDYNSSRGQPGLCTADAADLLLRGLSGSDWSWSVDERKKLVAAAHRLLDGGILSWGRERAEDPALSLHNISVIPLLRSAALAVHSNHPDADDLLVEAERRCDKLLRAREKERRSEGGSYDGFVMDTVTAWWNAPGGHQSKGRWIPSAAVRSYLDQCAYMATPGRQHELAPVGDTEIEMSFWTTAVLRLLQEIDHPQAAHLLHRVDASTMRAAGLEACLALAAEVDPASGTSVPSATAAADDRAPLDVCRLPHAIAARTGWTFDDALLVVCTPRSEQSHLHLDGGSVLLGWRGTWWIADPGYQQYLPGDERTWTIGPAAHNGMVVEDAGFARRAVGETRVHETDESVRIEVDLTNTYDPAAGVRSAQRTVAWDGSLLQVRDDIQLACSQSLQYRWHCGGSLAWGEADGRVRLGDGTAALYISNSEGPVGLGNLTRLPGSRGPLTLEWKSASRREHGVEWTFVPGK